MQYLAQFFSIEYWFGFPPIITQPLLIALVAVFGVFFIVGMVALMLYPRIENRWHRLIVRRGSSGAAWIGFLGLLLTFMRYERIPVFMYRYWFLFVDIVTGKQIGRAHV